MFSFLQEIKILWEAFANFHNLSFRKTVKGNLGLRIIKVFEKASIIRINLTNSMFIHTHSFWETVEGNYFYYYLTECHNLSEDIQE
jgi:hypothetical protein